MTWIIIGIVLVAAFGPVLWLMPSKKDRRLTAIRGCARQEGLLVELRRIPKVNPEAFERVSAGGRIKQPVVECAAYMLPLAQKLAHLPQWRLLRDETSESPRTGWTFDAESPSQTEYLAETLAIFDAALCKLPADVLAVEVSFRTLAFYWLEGAAYGVAQVTDFASMLRLIEATLEALEQQIQSAIDDQDP